MNDKEDDKEHKNNIANVNISKRKNCSGCRSRKSPDAELLMNYSFRALFFHRQGTVQKQSSTNLLPTCKLLFTRLEPHLFSFTLHFEMQSKKLQSSSLVHVCSRMFRILGSKKAMSTSMATTCDSMTVHSERNVGNYACV